jgi:hypothetical protein
MKAASGEMADVLRETYSTDAKGAADYGVKIIEISSVNTTYAANSASISASFRRHDPKELC